MIAWSSLAGSGVIAWSSLAGGGVIAWSSLAGGCLPIGCVYSHLTALLRRSLAPEH